MLAALLAGLLMPSFFTGIPLRKRDTFLAEHDSNYRPVMTRHVLWHATYIGLGFLSNSYVSGYKDSQA